MREIQKMASLLKRFSWVVLGVSLWGSLLGVSFAQEQNTEDNSTCATPILDQMNIHQGKQGESLDSIAAQYGIHPGIIVHFNPDLEQNPSIAGKSLFIPPINGIQIDNSAGETWEELGEFYGVRPDVLFEMNGCTEEAPNIVFIPGINWVASQTATSPKNYSGLSVYPLPFEATVALGYGPRPSTDENPGRFHSGLDLIAPLGTDIFAAEEGTVVFVGQQSNYGNIVIINHAGGWQTRYAHLESFIVALGQEVQAGEMIGKVGNTGTPDIAENHLHFEVRYEYPVGLVAVDPQFHLTSGASVDPLTELNQNRGKGE